MKRMPVLLLLLVAGCSTGLNQAQTRTWLRHVIPLPKQATVERTLQIAPADVVVRVQPGASNVELAAAKRLEEKLKTLASATAQTQPASAGRFEILLGICDADGRLAGATVPGAEKLAKLPQSDQAYVIAPDGANRLVLTGLTEKGVVYAALTMEQLLDGCSPGPQVTLPIARVLDWPDMAERGLWGPHTLAQTKWLAQSKLNIVETSVENQLKVTPDGRGHYTLPPRVDDARFGYNLEWPDQGRLYAVKIVPFISHMNGIFGYCQPKELFKWFPELRGKRYSDTKHALVPSLEIPCFAQPRIRQLLADWMREVAAAEGGHEICIWLSEDLMGLECACEACKSAGHYVMETRAFVAAWREARKTYPQLHLRVLLTQGSHATNDRIIAEIPPEAGVTYYDGGLTYNVTRDPMIYPMLEKFAASGRWLGVYPTIEPNYDIPWPWTSPTFMQFRMSEFVDKKLQNCSSFQPGYSALFALTAQGEWLWNAHGRSPREFAAAFATRNHVGDPEAFADWAMLVSDVGWDVHGYGMWFQGFFEELSRMVRDRKPARLGEGKLCQGVYRYFPTAKHIDDDLAACDKALAIAQKSLAKDYPEAVIETRCTAGLIRLLKDAYDMSTVLSQPSLPREADRLKLQQAMKRYSEDSLELLASYHDYLTLKKRRQQAFANIDDMVAKAALDIATALKPFGVRDPYGSCWPAKVGEWDNKLVESKKPVRKAWPVTARLAGAGNYTVRFGGNQTSRELLNISRVALASAPKGKPEELTELAQDKHFGRTWACWSENEVYTLSLKNVEANLEYFLVADVVAGGSAYGPEDINPMLCGGNVFFSKTLPAGQKMPDLPLEKAEASLKYYYEGPAFAPGKLRVGVIQSCYGSDQILARLQSVKDIDAQSIYFLPHHINKCQVVVYPQPTCTISLEQGGKWLQDFLRGGGGLIVTHDGVGYRGQPALAPEVCAKGVIHAADAGWRIDPSARQHPLAQGLEGQKVLPMGYYDLVTLQGGPQGTVIAGGSPSSQPAVIAGQSGKGRYVACGLCLGLGPGEKPAPLTPEETRLLENAVKWVSQEKR